MLDSGLILLQLILDEYKLIHHQINQLGEVIKRKPLETDGGILLRMPGLSITTAAELTAEIGNVHDFTQARQLLKTAVTNSIVRKSGCMRANHYRISKQDRSAFRNVVYQFGKNVSKQKIAMKNKGKISDQS